MESKMTDKKLQDLTSKTIDEFKSEEDFEEFTKALRKQFWESTLAGEMNGHLGDEKHDPRGHGSSNSRNGKSRKNLNSEHCEL